MKWPTIRLVARELRNVNQFADGECDVRLQVCEDGTWLVHFGDPSYDQDHRGYWGAGTVPGQNRRFNSIDLARDLIDQAKDQHAAYTESIELLQYALGMVWSTTVGRR